MASADALPATGVRRLFRGLICRGACAAAIAVASLPAHAGLGTAVEFYNAKINHYFLTAYPEEAAALDAGTNVKGWVRTGGQFTVFTDDAGGLASVCRFFGTPGVGPNSHFYTADPAECAKVKTLPAWTYEGIAFYIPLPSAGNCGANWPVYRSYYSDEISDANHRFTADLTAHVRMKGRRGDALEGIVMCAPQSDEEREADVVRFLEQATLGPTEALVQEVKAKGIAAWLDAQLVSNVTRYTQLPYFDDTPPVNCINDTTPPITPEKFCELNKLSHAPTGREFFRQSRTAPDQLRMRMAHVWHQILVATASPSYGIAEFQQRMRDHAFDRYEVLLSKYALSPVLGRYQSWAKNEPERDGVKPNENFARELMQLFTIGVIELNEDATPKVDAIGQPIPTYTQADIENMARVLTGFAYPPLPGTTSYWGNAGNFSGDMVPFDEYHDRGAKNLLKGRLFLPPGGSANAEFKATIRMLVDHHNTPPFISRQLIQKMVTSSPTSGYVARVATVFKDNGKGVRGDLAAVTRAILLDAEARGARKIDREYGRLREPVLFFTAMIRALDIPNDGHRFLGSSIGSEQPLFAPPSVFNYYPADYSLYEGFLPAPEFAIFSSAAFITRANILTTFLYFGDGAYPYIPDAIGTPIPTLSAFLPDAANVDALVERLNRLFLHGAMTARTRKTIVNAVRKVPEAETMRRVQLAIDLTVMSLQYQVQR